MDTINKKSSTADMTSYELFSPWNFRFTLNNMITLKLTFKLIQNSNFSYIFRYLEGKYLSYGTCWTKNVIWRRRWEYIISHLSNDSKRHLKLRYETQTLHYKLRKSCWLKKKKKTKKYRSSLHIWFAFVAVWRGKVVIKECLFQILF